MRILMSFDLSTYEKPKYRVHTIYFTRKLFELTALNLTKNLLEQEEPTTIISYMRVIQ